MKNRIYTPEILDECAIGAEKLAVNLRELARVNRWLGGHSNLLKGVKNLSECYAAGYPLRILELGCGGGDNLRALEHFARRQQLNWQFQGSDINDEAVAYARRQSDMNSLIRYKVQDVLNLDFQKLEADIVIFNLFLHHFTEAQIVEIIRRAMQSGLAVYISDLRRSNTAYHLFRIFSRVLNFSHIGRHDGKLSIKKGFIEDEWRKILEESQIRKYSIKNRWAFRHEILIPPKKLQI